MIPVSVLDLAPIVAGSDAARAFRNTADLARTVERLGYTRYWLAEHHNMPGIASAATAVVIGHVAAATTSIRVGAGGVMLPNHAPLIIAEQFGTLASLFPGRIDLALGRAPGTDQTTMRALRRDVRSAEYFPQEVVELLSYFGPSQAGQIVRAVPGAGLEIPVWLLGSSTFSARLAAQLGLPFAFASHFAPDDLMAALDAYRGGFEPSARLAAPYAMAGLTVVAADTHAAASRLFTSLQQQFLSLARGKPLQLQPPVDDMAGRMTDYERSGIEHRLRYAIVGDAQRVRERLDAFVSETGVEEVIVTSNIYDHEARKRSYAIVAEAAGLIPLT